LVPVAATAADGFSLSAGVEYITGDYGGDDSVDETWVPVTAAWQQGRLELRATIPYLVVDGPEDSTSTEQGGMMGGDTPSSTDSGIGDVVLSGTYMDVLQFGDRAAIDLTGKVKLGTANADDGLGTGETDYSVQADAITFFERSLLIGTVGYLVRGDSNDNDPDNAWFYSAGGVVALSDRADAGLFLDYRQSTYSDSDSPLELTATIDFGLTDRSDLRAFGLAGLNDGSPDWGLGFSVRHRF